MLKAVIEDDHGGPFPGRLPGPISPVFFGYDQRIGSPAPVQMDLVVSVSAGYQGRLLSPLLQAPQKPGRQGGLPAPSHREVAHGDHGDGSPLEGHDTRIVHPTPGA